ncbi:MAG: hypothetical protein O3A46_11875 [Candidatus Poribacteria bacterium]|nr:hypothetical protein [Candidatus Poribacteria bacterium]
MATREALRQMVNTLPDSELDAAQEALQRLFERHEDQTRQEYKQELIRSGLLISTPPPPTDETIRRFRGRKRITVKGKPLSDRIVEERR